MNTWKIRLALVGSLGIYVILWLLLHPILGFMLDSDAVAYLTIAERGAHGDWLKSINGLWSPLNSWMLIPFIIKGYSVWPSALALNALFGGILIIQSFYLLKLFIHEGWVQTVYLLTIPIVMAYAVYFQVFGDVLQLVFVLLYLQLLWSSVKLNIVVQSILCGLIMGMAYYAKAYSFVFFILHFTVSICFLYKRNLVEKAVAIKRWAIGLFVFILTILPWAWALKTKYHSWSLSGLSGKLNMSWYINSGKSFKDQITLLIPPSYSDSPSFWEDPYLSQSELSTPWSSFSHFVKWILRVGYTSLEALFCLNEISILGIAILLGGVLYYFNGKHRESSQHSKIQWLIITCFVLPIGYLMMHIETRYLWLLIFLLFILGARWVLDWKVGKRIKTALVFVLAFSFVAFPILQIKKLKYKNKDLFEKAEWLGSLGVKGKFTSNLSDAGQMWVIAYLNHSSYYTIERDDYSEKELIDELKRYHLDYFLFEAEHNTMPLSLDNPMFIKEASKYGLDVYRINYEISPKP